MFAREGSTWTSTPTELTSPEPAREATSVAAWRCRARRNGARGGAREHAGKGRRMGVHRLGREHEWVGAGRPARGSRRSRAKGISGERWRSRATARGARGRRRQRSLRRSGVRCSNTRKAVGGTRSEADRRGEVLEGHSATASRCPKTAARRWWAPATTNGGNGAAWVFARSGSTWIEQGASWSAREPETNSSVTAWRCRRAATARSSAPPTSKADAARRGCSSGRARTGPRPCEAGGGRTEKRRARFGSRASRALGRTAKSGRGGPGESGQARRGVGVRPGPAVKSIKPHVGANARGHQSHDRPGGTWGSSRRFASVERSRELRGRPGRPRTRDRSRVAPAADGQVDVTVDTPFGASSTSTCDRTLHVPGGKKKAKRNRKGRRRQRKGELAGRSGNGGNEQASRRLAQRWNDRVTAAWARRGGARLRADVRSGVRREPAEQADRGAGPQPRAVQALGTGAGSCAGNSRCASSSSRARALQAEDDRHGGVLDRGRQAGVRRA